MYLLLCGAACASYALGLIFYRLFLHPLAKFPGSRLAACSLWYEFYYDVILRGQLIWQIEKWHRQYGPIIRINPNELHIDDPDYSDEVYGSQTRKRDKYGPWVALAGTPGSSFSTVTHDHHRLRRGALNPFFSKKAVVALESLIQEKVAKLASRFERACSTGEVIRADVAFTALTMDVICQYTFAADDSYLEEDDFKLEWKECLSTGFEAGAIMRQFPWMGDMMKSLPPKILAKVNPPLYMLTFWRTGVEKRAQAVLDAKEPELRSTRKTIFHELRDGDLPANEKTLNRLCDEAQILTGAGSETTAQTLAYITFYLLTNPEKLERLRNELKSILPNPKDVVSYTVIERLPYVYGVVSEGLRLSYGVTTRLPRVATDEQLRYKQWKIPDGTPVSMTAYFTLMNPTIFPQPESFLPERWLSEDPSLPDRSLQRHLVNFGKGSRQCVGMNLAYAEMYLAIATQFRRFKMELYETTLDDVTIKHDFFVAAPNTETKGIRIKILGEYSD